MTQVVSTAKQYIEQKYNEDDNDFVKSEQIGIENDGRDIIYNVRLVYRNGKEYIAQIRRPNQMQTRFFVTARQSYQTQPMRV